MNRELTGTLLPLGSMVRLQDTDNDELLYLIVARAITKGPSDTVLPRYRVAPHPYGDVPSQEILSIRDSQIVEVVFMGYEDEQDQQFLDNLFDMMANGQKSGSAPAVSTVSTDVETLSSSTGVVDSLSQEKQESLSLQTDPFYKFRERR